MKYLGFALLGILALLLLFIVIAAIRAVMIKAKPNTNAPAINPTDAEADDYAKSSPQWCRCPPFPSEETPIFRSFMHCTRL